MVDCESLNTPYTCWSVSMELGILSYMNVGLTEKTEI